MPLSGLVTLVTMQIGEVIFGGYGAALRWHATALGIVMLLGRHAIIIPMLAIAGSVVRKPQSAVTSGTFPTHGPPFVTLLVLAVLIPGALTIFPAPALGPIAEEAARLAGQSFRGTRRRDERERPIWPAFNPPRSGRASRRSIPAPCGATR